MEEAAKHHITASESVAEEVDEEQKLPTLLSVYIDFCNLARRVEKLEQRKTLA